MEQTIQKRISVTDQSWVSVDVYGDSHAPGLLVVPGVMSDARGWRHVARAVDAWESVWVLNRRGRAPSGPLGDAYSVCAEVADLNAVFEELGAPSALFGWSYGALIALLLAAQRPVDQVIAYEPVAAGFGSDALPALREADAARDWDSSVQIVNRQVSGFSQEYVDALRSDRNGWSTLCRLSEPLYSELRALSLAELGSRLASQARAVDLIIGEQNVGHSPYWMSFEEIRAHLVDAVVHRLPGQGHLAHVTGPVELAQLINTLAPHDRDC